MEGLQAVGRRIYSVQNSQVALDLLKLLFDRTLLLLEDRGGGVGYGFPAVQGAPEALIAAGKVIAHT